MIFCTKNIKNFCKHKTLFTYKYYYHNNNGAERAKIICNKVATLAHSIAQGKVGSGFDVSSAFYGNLYFSNGMKDEINEFLVIKLNILWKQKFPSCFGTKEIHDFVSSGLRSCILDHNEDLHQILFLSPFDFPGGIEIILGY